MFPRHLHPDLCPPVPPSALGHEASASGLQDPPGALLSLLALQHLPLLCGALALEKLTKCWSPLSSAHAWGARRALPFLCFPSQVIFADLPEGPNYRDWPDDEKQSLLIECLASAMSTQRVIRVWSSQFGASGLGLVTFPQRLLNLVCSVLGKGGGQSASVGRHGG